MKKIVSLLLLALVFIISGGTAAASSLNKNDNGTRTRTVCLNDSYESRIPLTYNQLSSPQKTQMLYPEDLLRLPYCEISKIMFYPDMDFSISQNVSVSFTIVGANDFSDNSFRMFSISAENEVYNGTLTATSGNMEIELSTPFTYKGGNLLIEVFISQPEEDLSNKWVYFRGNSSYDYVMSVIQFDDFDRESIDDSFYFLPATTFEYNVLPCTQPFDLTFQHSQTETIATWSGGEATSFYEIEWGAYDFSQENRYVVTVTDTFFVFTETLTPNSDYGFFVRAICSDGDTTDWTFKGFTMPFNPISTPFTFDFETETDSVSWIFAHESDIFDNANKWHIGAAAGFNSDHALYISNDDGETNQYSTNRSSYVFACRDIYFDPAETYVLDFDWRCYGESGYDYFQVLLTSPEPIFDANKRFYEEDGALFYDWNYNCQFYAYDTVWRHYRTILPSSYAGQFLRLYFLWLNDESDGHQPPAAIDNISIASYDCSLANITEIRPLSSDSLRLRFDATAIYEITYSTSDFNPESATGTSTSINANTAILTGLEADSTYYIYVRKICSPENVGPWNFTPIIVTMPRSILTVPFTIDFEDATINAGFNIANNNVEDDYPNGWYIGTAAAFESEHGLYISADGGETEGYETENNACLVFAYQDVYFPNAESYTISFDVRIGGEFFQEYRKNSVGKGDWLIVSIDDVYPANAAYEDDYIMSNNCYSAIYNAPFPHPTTNDYYWTGYDASTGTYNTDWWHFEYTLSDYFYLQRYAGKVQRLYFVWSNDHTNGNLIGAAIDNISITAEGIIEPVDPIEPVEPTSITERAAEKNVQLYPNPATDVLHVKADNCQQYEIFNFVGQRVLSGNFTDGTAQISTNNLNNGVYFIRIDGGNAKKFVKL